jgi:DNA-binding winged helix-turn-helix (wHTH) protein
MGALARGDIFRFAGFRLDRCGLLGRDGLGGLSPVPIGGRAFDLLSVLVERHGEVLSKAEIMAPVWPNMAVEDGNLTLQMAALRRKSWTVGGGRGTAFKRWHAAAIVSLQR